MLLENDVILNGFAAPCVSAIWGLNPTPKPLSPEPVVEPRLGANPVPNPLVPSPVPSPLPSPVVSGCWALRAPSPVGCWFNPDAPRVEVNPFGWLWVPSPGPTPKPPTVPSPPRVVEVVVAGPGEETVDLGGDPNCPWFSLATAGVVGPDPGIGGKLSSNDAPNDDDGLNVFKPVRVPKPVVCEVTPVG